jgi:small subunit ribosomal protein S1
LSLRDADGDPWIAVSERYPVGRSVTGVVEKTEKFGYFVTLEPGITGLLPQSKISPAAEQLYKGKLKKGDAIAVTIETVDREKRRIALAPGDGAAAGDWRQHGAGESSSMGQLGEKLKEALAIRKKK